MRRNAYCLILSLVLCAELHAQTRDARELRTLGVQEYQSGNLLEAESYLRSALNEHPDDTERAGILTDLGTLLIEEERLSAAEEAYSKALSIYQRGSDNKSATVLAMRHLGAVYSIQRRDNEAVSVLKKALKAATATPQVSPRLISQIQNTMGVAYFRQEDTKKAERFFQQGLQTLTDAKDLSEIYVAPILNNLGAVYARRNKLQLAEDTLIKATNLIESELGPSHPAITYTLDVLGVVYTRMGRYEDAEAQFHRSISILEQNKSAFEVRIARTLKGLADVYLKAGKQNAAEEALTRAAGIARRNLTSHPDMAGILEIYSQLLDRAGKPEEASVLRSEARRARTTMSNTVNAYIQP